MTTVAVEGYNWWYFFLGIIVLGAGIFMAVAGNMVRTDSTSSNTVKNLGLALLIVGIIVAVIGFIMIVAAFWGGNTPLETVGYDVNGNPIVKPVGVYGAPYQTIDIYGNNE